MPIISVIVPVYRAEPYLRTCVDSILAQTFTDFELILVDDGSPDNSGEICNKYAEIDNRVQVIHQNNRGASSARNAGLEAANGAYISFVDADDVVHPDLFLRSLQEIKEYDSVCFNYSKRAVDGTIIGHSEFCPGVVCWENEEEQFNFLINSYMKFKYGFAVWNRLYRKDIIDKNHIRFEEHVNYAEDIFFNFLYYLHTQSLKCLAEGLYFYIDNHQSLIHISQGRPFFNRVNELAKAIDIHLFAQGGLSLIKKKFPVLYLSVFHHELVLFKGHHPEYNIKQIRKLIVTDIQDFGYFSEKTALLFHYKRDLQLCFGKIETAQIISDYQYYRDGRIVSYRFRSIFIFILKSLSNVRRRCKLFIKCKSHEK